MLDKALRAEYSKQRKHIQRQNKSLAKKGLPVLELPKVRELKDTKELKRKLKKADEWISSGRSTIKGAEKYLEETRKQRQQKREETRRRKNEKRREQRREDWIEEQPERKQWFIRYMEDKGLTIRNEKEFKQWQQYVNKRKAMQSRKDKYEMEKFVDEYNRLKEKGLLKARQFQEVMKDFDAFLHDQRELERRMKKMQLRYDKTFIDQMYEEYIERLLNDVKYGREQI